MQNFFNIFGGKTKLFSTLLAVAVALETAGVIPVGAVQTATSILQAVFAAGTVWGVADKLDRLLK